MNDKIPTPPPKPFFIPLEFWLDAIAYLDKRVEIVATGSGYGVIEMNVKLQNGKIFEVEFQEKIRVRKLIEKAGAKGSNIPNKPFVAGKETE